MVGEHQGFIGSCIHKDGLLLAYLRFLKLFLVIIVVFLWVWFAGLDVRTPIKAFPKSTRNIANRNSEQDLLYAVLGLPDKHQVHYSSVQDVVNCVSNQSLRLDKSTRIYFIGDSRIRQQFYSFLEMMPEYDRIWDGEPNRETDDVLHFDMNVTFPILNVQIVLRWRPVINDTFIAEIQNWSSVPASSKVFLLIGMNVHHMFPANGHDYREYERQLRRFARALQSLTGTRANGFKVFRMMNQDVMDSSIRPVYFTTLPISIHLAKMRQCNALARKILQGYKELEVMEWNYYSVDDYIRACELLRREGKGEFFNCYHTLHLGYNVIRLNTQRFMDRLCDYRLD